MADSAEIFSAILARQKKALSFHEQLCIIFNFLNLHGFKRLHEYQYRTESDTMQEIHRHYIKQHDRLIRVVPVESASEIPNDWYNAERNEVDGSIISQYAKREFQAYVQWESDTLNELERYAHELMEIGEVKDFAFVKAMVCDVAKELERAKRLYYKMSATGFDVAFIEEMQDEIHDKFKEKLKKCR